MNIKQRVAILLGIILLILCGIFQPYEGEWRRPAAPRLAGFPPPSARENLRAYLGYYFILSPPQPWEVRNKILPLPDLIDYDAFYVKEINFHSYILVSRVWLQIGIISIVTLGLFFLFKNGSKRSQ